MATLTEKFFEEEKRVYPKSGFRFKNNILMSKIIAFYQRPFNPGYQYWITTTIHPETRFGSDLQGDDWRQVKVEFHENVHKFDAHREGKYKFNLKYAYPQILAIPALIGVFIASGFLGLVAFLILMSGLHVGLAITQTKRRKEDPKLPTKAAVKAFNIIAGVCGVVSLGLTIIGGGYWALLWLAVALFLNPYPPMTAKWRRDAEIRGYVATLYKTWIRHGNFKKENFDYFVTLFTGPTYFWMETNREKVEHALNYQISRFTGNEDDFLRTWKTSDDDRGDTAAAIPYRMLKSFMDKEKLRDAA